MCSKSASAPSPLSEGVLGLPPHPESNSDATAMPITAPLVRDSTLPDTDVLILRSRAASLPPQILTTMRIFDQQGPGTRGMPGLASGNTALELPSRDARGAGGASEGGARCDVRG